MEVQENESVIQYLPEHTIGQRIKKARMSMGLTQKELADAAEIHPNMILNYEHDKYSPSLFNAVCIAKVLNVTLDYMAGLEDDYPNES